MKQINLNEDRIEKCAKFLKENAPNKYYDFSFEKPKTQDVDLATNYLGAVIALNYGFWRLKESKLEIDYYEWNGEKLKGAIFLWTKSQLMLSNEPSFFTAQQLANLSKEDFHKWLEDSNGRIPFKDPDKRYSLIQDYGRKLSEVESLQRIYEKVGRKLREFIYSLEEYDAYSDFPFFKKAHLLCKIMERIGKWKMIEESDFKKIPPIDYHIMNMAWKLELFELPSLTQRKLHNYKLLPPGHEFLIRLNCAEAYQELASYSGLDPYKIDDAMWMESRKNCQKEPYTCSKCLFDTFCTKNQIGFPLVETHRY